MSMHVIIKLTIKYINNKYVFLFYLGGQFLHPELFPVKASKMCGEFLYIIIALYYIGLQAY